MIAFLCTNPFSLFLIEKKNRVCVAQQASFLIYPSSDFLLVENMADFDAIYQDEVADEVLEEVVALSPEPIVIRGAGNMTV